MTTTKTSHRRRITTVSLGVIVLGGCILDSESAGQLPPAGSTGPGAGSVTAASGSGSTHDPGATGPAATSTPAADTSAGSSGLSDDDSGTGPGPGPEPDTGGDSAGTGEAQGICPDPLVGYACEAPGASSHVFTVLVDGMELIDQEYEQTCSFTGSMTAGDTQTIELSCGPTATPVVVVLTSQAPNVGWQPPVVGTSLELFYWAQDADPVNIERYVTLRDPVAGLQIAGIDDPAPWPPAGFDISPLVLDVAPTECPTEDTEFELLMQDAALEVTLGAEQVVVFGNSSATVGLLDSYVVTTNEVERLHCVEPDHSYDYYVWSVGVMIVSVPEGG